MEKKYKKLAKNTFIFALGTFGSKILSFLIVPLYTYVLSTTDYGTIDLITSTINLLIPFTTLLIYESAIRFLIGKEMDEKNIFNNCAFIFLIGCVLSIPFSPLLLYLLNLSEYFLFFNVLLVLTSYRSIFSQYLRATGDNWGFSIAGIIHTFFIVFLNLLFLLVFKKGMVGYLYSLLISQIITNVFIFIRCKTFKILNFKYINFKHLKQMLKYSIPLVPNNIMWWIMNAGDKYVINYYLGTSANGIFSISYKIPTILTMLFSIFMQAWQVSAIEEGRDNSQNDFYKNVFKFISISLIIITSFIIVCIKPLFENIIGSDYISAWKYVPLLCIATLFNCFSSFAGVVYIVEKNSKKSFYTTFIGAVSNLLVNFILIRYLGLLGVAIGTIFGYFSVMLWRFKDYGKHFKISLWDRNIIISIIILIAESIIYIFTDDIIRYSGSTTCIILILLISKKNIVNIVKIIKSKVTAILKTSKKKRIS